MKLSSVGAKSLIILGVLSMGIRISSAEQEEMSSTETAQLEQKSDGMIRVMTYNIRRDGKEKAEERKWEKRLPMISAVIEQVRPDLMCLQEAKKNQIDDMSKRFDNYSALGEGRGETSWGPFGKGEDESCPIFYNKSKFTLIESGTFWLGAESNWFNRFFTYGPLPRICTFGKFKDTQTDLEFYVYNTHLDHLMGDWTRLNGLRDIVKHIKSRGDDAPMIITGDFNMVLTTAVRDELEGYVPAKELAQSVVGPKDFSEGTESATRTGWTDDELKPIDHIMVSANDFTVSQYGVIESSKPYPSDHRPVVADVKIKSLADID